MYFDLWFQNNFPVITQRVGRKGESGYYITLIFKDKKNKSIKINYF